MNLNFPLLKPIRIFLFPVSFIYGLVIHIRNWCFDKKIIPSTSFNLPIICVGNLAVGGTGKSPMVEYLIRLLKNDFEIAVLSRGYKRRTRGYTLANETSTALDIGDEPMQFHIKFSDVPIAVGEERVVAIPQLLHEWPATKAIILDDALQHRSINAGLNILLTDFNNLFTRDWFLPTGNLRDAKKSYKRSDIIVVTKCKPGLTSNEKLKIIKEIAPLPKQEVFFSTIQYGTVYHIINKRTYVINEKTEVLLVTAIANPEQIKKYLTGRSGAFYELSYSDHRIFIIDDLKEMMRKFSQIKTNDKIILTTEKDAVRLVKFQQELAQLPFYVLPIEPAFLFDEENKFNNLVKSFIANFKNNQKTDASEKNKK
ncbi:MAG: tetraacyldisaccharide 4'-kinase [Bacteroidetes bacterium]|nr:tetraacyldisaccharide 4'-kinase [Bacteroidota bacterium]MBS1973859.1 tetraacyldisaccharide 4'-kinase [Bacteroidota bacterium]